MPEQSRENSMSIPSIPQADLERIRRTEGWRRTSDIIDDHDLAPLFEKIGSTEPKVEIFSEQAIDAETEALVAEVATFAKDTGQHFRDKFLEVVGEYKQTGGSFSPEIVRFLETSDAAFPSFRISVGSEAVKELDRCNLAYNHSMADKAVLLNFQLPPPLAKFWWKGGRDLYEDEGVVTDVGANIIERGWFYLRLIDEIWKAVGHAECETNFSFLRLNDIGEHDPNKYYYLWEIKKQKSYN